MKFNLSFGIACAIVLHVGFILFGGLLFINHKKDHGTLQQVELLSEDIAAEKEKPNEQEPEKTAPKRCSKLRGLRPARWLPAENRRD